jgi:DNA primase
MSRIPRDLVDAIRDRTDIVEVVSRHVTLTRKGGSWTGLCPFHQEKSPSFNVIPNKGMYWCFGCQAGGDVFRFLMQVEGLSFIQAVKDLGNAVGITVEDRELTEAERRAFKERATLYDVLEGANQRFESWLWTSAEGAPARAYLEKRAITAETARAWRLGWAPGGTRLVDWLHQQGFPQKLALDAGLARQRDDGGRVYDTFRERLIIPIRDERGRVIAFGGRLLEGDGPKYINSPETALYDKGKTLFGLDLARPQIQRRDRVLVVEGYFDVISLAQAGFGEAVATCGTSLTQDHLEKIRRLTRNAVVLFDADEAGARAATRSLPMFVAAGLLPTRLQIPGAKDPDEFVREEGAAAMEAALGKKEPLERWVAMRLRERHGYDAFATGRILEELQPVLPGLPPAHLRELAHALHVPELAIFEAARRPASGAAEAPRPSAIPIPRDMVHLLWLLVHRYDQTADIASRAIGAHPPPGLLAAWPMALPVVARLLHGENVAAILSDELTPELTRALSTIVARTELYEASDAERAMVQVLVNLTSTLLETARTREMDRAQEDPLATARVAAIYKRVKDLDKAAKSKQIPAVLAQLTLPLPG